MTIHIDLIEMNEHFEYRDGTLYWKQHSWKNKIGTPAGTVKGKGYLNVWLNGVSYRVHRIIYAMFHGHAPDYIDHIDNNRLNNRIGNLRETTNSENLRKTPIRKVNTLEGPKWRTNIDREFKYFDTETEALDYLKSSGKSFSRYPTDFAPTKSLSQKF
jgi:hypothetical protein